MSRTKIPEFTEMINTTGVTTSINDLYIANNRVITRISSLGEKKNIPHNYDWVGGITSGPHYIFGIYRKDNKDGIFSMKISNEVYKEIQVDYDPVNIVYTELVIVRDKKNRIFVYSSDLALVTNTPSYSAIEQSFVSSGFATGVQDVYYSLQNQVWSGRKNVELFKAPGNVFSIVPYLGYLFVVYESGFSEYSILQYDTSKKETVKTLPGGYIAGPQIYSCIYKNELYLSMSVNKKVSLYDFDIPELSKYVPSGTFSYFDLPDKLFVEEPTYIDPKIKEKQETYVLDPKSAESSLWAFYLWGTICILLAISSYLMIQGQSSIIFLIIAFILFLFLLLYNERHRFL